MIGLRDSTKDATKGHIAISAPWAGLLDHPGREFKPRCSLAIPGRMGHSFICFIFAILLTIGLLLIFTVMCVTGKEKRGRLVEWVEKASFDRLNKLFVISSSERHHQTFLTGKNLLAVVRESQLYIIPILPCLAPKVLVSGEHHVLNDLLSYKKARAAYSKAHQDRLDQREKNARRGR